MISGVGLRPWVKPVIRYLCSATGQEELANTLVAGMDAITMSGGRPTDDLWVNENYTALFAALLWWTSVRAKAAAKGREVARKPSLQQRREVISLLTQARKAVTVTNTDDGDPWEGWVGMKPREFNKAVETVEERSWLGDWWTGIDAIVNPIDWDKVDVPDGDDADLVEPIRVRRADTMFQDKYDYLSEARMADFKAWRTDILASIAERKTGGDAMEIDTR